MINYNCDNQTLLNYIELLKHTLEFYSIKSNYIGNENSKIYIDHGELARSTIKILNELENVEDYISELSEMINNTDNTEEFLNIIKNIKK